jgi:hypothetical protein
MTPPPLTISSKRLVLFVGPHKSASTSIQTFFIEHAANTEGSNNNSMKHPSFENWTWPYAPMATHPAAYSDLVKHYPKQDQQWHDSRRAELYYTMSRVWDLYQNVILGDEEFDRMGDTVHSHRNGLQPLKNIVQLLQPPRLDLVVNYRTPRHTHWLSIWKQISRGKPYRGFVCQGTKPWEHLENQGNPLAIVRELLLQHWNVTLIDMGGVERDGLDISHVLACEVLGVPCENGWVQGLEHTSMHANNRSGDPGLTNVQLNELEWILRQRDCSYMDELKHRHDDGQLTVLHQDASLWQDCDKFDSSFQRSLRNTTFLLQLIQSQVDCGSYATSATAQGLSISKHKEESSRKVNSHHSEKKVIAVLEPPSFLRDTRRQINVPVTPDINELPLQLLLSTESLDANDTIPALEQHLKGFVVAQHFLVTLMLLWTLQKLREMLRRGLPKR